MTISVMRILERINRPCTWVQRGNLALDQYGDPQTSNTSIDTLCELQTVTRATYYVETPDGSIGLDLFKIFLLPDILPDNTDAIIVDGDTYEFTGDPVTRRSTLDGGAVFTEGWVRRSQ